MVPGQKLPDHKLPASKKPVTKITDVKLHGHKSPKKELPELIKKSKIS